MYTFYRQYNSLLNITSSNYQAKKWFQSIIEEYKLKEIPYNNLERKKRIGRGGSGTVYLAKSSLLDEKEKIPYLVMEYANNRTLREYLRNNKLEWLEKIQLARQIAEGMSYLHDIDITHRYDASLPLKIIQGLREKPILGTPVQYIDLYSKCWYHEPNKRPSMLEIFQQLNFLELDLKYEGTN
ncbi:5756_t:CDS:2 [Cetraspora pellucida]|uniref:5756_t:CDS:1 n=1 Tax=Cetraspora pellucida TaxID=1433469 RepID=A0A9N8Z9L9_9GLOM|nr:5756_t:CDS:2 [Cetraspora pellucida]